uniref:SH2 domain-containing protein n=1 Tax=Cyprinodon variegatus TaxID=28743 RepID=A0A3Q2E7L3_CYPVA
MSSLPVVIVSSSNQVPSAWASIMWSNMVSTGEPMNLSLFLDPPALTWQQVAQLLNWQFLSVGRRGLDQDQLSVLQDKIMGRWTVWMWIDGILDLIKKYLSELWKNGYIMGFVSKRRTSSLLLKKPTGTFLIRFSESIRDGAITFSWVDHSSGESHVHAVQPYTKKELSVLSLPDAINHYTLTTQGRSSNPLLYLYPDIPKDSAFGSYYQVSGKESCLTLMLYSRHETRLVVALTCSSPNKLFSRCPKQWERGLLRENDFPPVLSSPLPGPLAEYQSVPDGFPGEKWLLCCPPSDQALLQESPPHSACRCTHTCLLPFLSKLCTAGSPIPQLKHFKETIHTCVNGAITETMLAGPLRQGCNDLEMCFGG